VRLQGSTFTFTIALVSRQTHHQLHSTACPPPDAMNGYPAPAAASVWQEHTNKADGKKYYFNPVTQVTTWEKPPELRDEVEVRGSRSAQVGISC
jgi:hypothetical protein